MPVNEYLKDQKTIFRDLLAATVLELDLHPEVTGGEFSVGANANAMSFRNCGRGILPGIIARAVLPDSGEALPSGHMSELYPAEALLGADVFELRSFHGGKAARLRYEKGELAEFSVRPDFDTPEGLLFHLEWDAGLPGECVLTAGDVVSAMRRVASKGSPLPALRFKPWVHFNGGRLFWWRDGVC